MALSPAVALLTLSGPAMADRPDAWETPPDVSPLDFLLVIAIIPAALFLVITLLSSIGGAVRSHSSSYQPGLAWRNEPEWFGGPRDGLAKVDEQRPVATGAEAAPERGGASGRW